MTVMMSLLFKVCGFLELVLDLCYRIIKVSCSKSLMRFFLSAVVSSANAFGGSLEVKLGGCDCKNWSFFLFLLVLVIVGGGI
jgi:hypothetical protein